MARCFVIQPFDKGKFDRRFRETFKPAIEAAGLEAYRVDYDPDVDVPIDAIEEGISSSEAVLADITLNNPNVWYELGFAFALNRPVAMICSDEREGKFPFDIQHRTVIPYETGSRGGFEDLSSKITTRLQSFMKRKEAIQDLALPHAGVSDVEGLSQLELAVLAALASNDIGDVVTTWTVKNDVERAGITAVGFNVGMRRLVEKGFVRREVAADERGEEFSGWLVVPQGWEWIDKHEGLFVVTTGYGSSKRTAGSSHIWDDDKEIPF